MDTKKHRLSLDEEIQLADNIKFWDFQNYENISKGITGTIGIVKVNMSKDETTSLYNINVRHKRISLGGYAGIEDKRLEQAYKKAFKNACRLCKTKDITKYLIEEARKISG